MRVTRETLPSAGEASSRGVISVRQTRWGTVIQKWPKKRGRARSGYDFYRQKEFGIVAGWAAAPYAHDYTMAEAWARGTTLVPRDILMTMIMGTFYDFEGPENPGFYSARMVNPNPQYILDLIGDTPGSLIMRADIGWVLIPPGEPGQVLAYGGPNDIFWDDAPGGGVDTAITLTASAALSGHRAIKLSGSAAAYATNTNPDDASLYLGLSQNAASLGEEITVQLTGLISNPGTWTWTPGLPVFLGTSGNLTQTPPSGAADFSLTIGDAVAADVIDLRPFAPVFL